MKKLMMILCTILCANILAAQTFTSGGLNYEIIDNNSVKVARQNSYDISGSVVIPSTVTYDGTTYSVIFIGDYAFGGCSGLTSVTIPNSVTSIGGSAFNSCSGLTSVTIPNSVTSIGGSAFYCCSGLTSVTIPNSVTSIGKSAFSGCSGLTSVTIPNSVTSIGDYAFSGCSGLTSVTIPTGVTSIGGGAFSHCSSLTSINVASGNTHYSSIDGVLYNYVQNTLIQCPGAKTSVTIPTGVTSIGSSAFYGCSGLTSINVVSGNTHYSSIDGVLYNYVQDTLIQCPGAKTSVTIPNSVTSIGYGAFYGCSGLTSATIPNSVTSIGEGAFWDCSGLTSVTIGNSVTSIGRWAFSGCSSLTTLNFDAINYPDVVSTDDYFSVSPFTGTALTTVNIGDSVQRIPANIFRGCINLTTLNFNAINCHFQRLTSYGYGSSYCPFDGIPLTTVNIGDSVQRIPNNFVRGCGGLTSVTIPNSVTSIGDSAFENCSGLTSVTIGNRVTSIGNSAFKYCSGLTTLNFNAIDCQDFEAYYYTFDTSLTTVNIGDSVQRIPNNFVSGCSGLTSITLPNSLTSIGDWAFSGCSGLTSITLPNSLTSISNAAFNGCSGLTSVTIPNSVTSIGGRAFSSCSGLTSVTIPNSVTSIGGRAFSGCSSLTSVTIGNSLTSIGDRAFYECLNLSSLISLATVPPTIGNEAFPYPNICTVTVPCGSLEAYTASTCYWSVYFPQRITESSSFELSVSANEEAYGRVEVETQSCNVKTLTAIANEGYEFTAWNDGNTENPRTVTVTSDTAFVAIFTETETTPTITVTVNDATMGSATYTMDGNTAVLTATPNEGYVFTGWNDGNTENPRTVTITSDTAFMAIFAEAVSTPTITLTVNDETMGSASYTMDGNTAVLTATPNEGYVFTGWNDGNTENPRTVSITSDTAFVAIFTEAVSTPTITVTVNDETMGSATYTMDGNTAVLTATANEGYEFTGWNDGNTENPRTVTVTSDTTFMAIFAETETTPTITLTVNDETMGSASYTMDGNTAVLTATPNEGYSFLTWSDGNTENPRTVTVTSDTAFTAIFTETEITPTITVTVNDATMGSATYTMDGNTAVLTATPNEGYEFTGWNDGNTENPRTVTVTSDTAFMAIFTASSSSSLQAVNARGFALYPNPAKSFVTLEFEALQENTLLQILDLNGRRVRTLDLKAGQETLRIDLGDLPKGVYTIMIGNTTKKLIVE